MAFSPSPTTLTLPTSQSEPETRIVLLNNDSARVTRTIKKPPIQKATKPLNLKRKVGRNEPCPCGSGKKFKNCHLPRD